MGVLAVIPARFGSSRFPGKPLALIQGKPMIVWTLERTLKAISIDKVIVATDDDRIFNVVVDVGGDAVMTPSNLPSGTDRVAWVSQKYDYEIVVNVQGDEPLIDPNSIDLAVDALIKDRASVMSTLATPIKSSEDLWDRNIVKVIVDSFGRAIYFSRAPIPFHLQGDSVDLLKNGVFFRHLGLYVYRCAFLEQITKTPMNWIEKVESLEQLRVLGIGGKIHVRIVEKATPSVDTPEDLEKIEDAMHNG